MLYGTELWLAHITSWPLLIFAGMLAGPVFLTTQISAVFHLKERAAHRYRKDRWGLSWQITPRALTDALAAGGAEAKRAFAAMIVDEEDRCGYHRGRATRLRTEEVDAMLPACSSE